MPIAASPRGHADASAVLERAAAAVTARRRADVEVLESALAWAHAHVVDADADPEIVARWGSDTIPAAGSAAALFGERAVPLAGVGAPLVAEFAVVELSAVLGQSHEATLALLGDVLDLAHRLPRLWALVRSLRVPVGLGREAARVSRDLGVLAAEHADRLLVWQPSRLNPHRIGVLVHEARLYADPDRAVADHDEALAARRVDVRHDEGAPGTSAVFMTLDTADAVALDHTVSAMAATMRALGHDAALGVRRAHAVGMLADPQRALDLLAAGEATDLDNDPAVCTAEDATYATPTPFAGRGGGGEVRLMLHVSDRDLLAGGARGVARCEELGPMLLGRLRDWLLTAAKVTITPVVDLDPAAASMAAVDRHDPPPRMATAVRLRDETCVYPRCGRSARRADLDHIVEYLDPADGGPPGQTRPANLAPLCRRHHRAKTFGDFTYRLLPDGSYEWTLPSKRIVTTDPRILRPQPLPQPAKRRSRP